MLKIIKEKEEDLSMDKDFIDKINTYLHNNDETIIKVGGGEFYIEKTPVYILLNEIIEHLGSIRDESDDYHLIKKIKKFIEEYKIKKEE